MQSILFLCHRLPWPPDKGDKIRSYHVLRRLAEHYRVYLGAFVDDPDDWRHFEEVKAVCADVCIRPLTPSQARWRALASLARGEALTLGCYRDPVMQAWVDRVLGERKPDMVLCFSSGVASFVMQRPTRFVSILSQLFPSPFGRRWRAAPDEGPVSRRVESQDGSSGFRACAPSPAPSGHPLPEGEGNHSTEIRHQSGHPKVRRVMDFVDADSDKWRQYAAARRGPVRMLFAREARHVAEFERAVATEFDASLFVSEAEAGFFRSEVPAVANKVHGVANGVDADYWDPQRKWPSPYRAGEKAVVFTGAMDYRANIDAVCWFADAIWPGIRAAQPEARFYIVGSRPTRDVRRLADAAGIVVTGRVDDMRPYLAHAHAVAAPLRIARGIQNKVLEALAMEKVVLATPTAWEGIRDFEGREGCIGESPEMIATEAVRSLGPAEPIRVPAARAMVRSRFDWSPNLDAYEAVLRGPVTGAPVMVDNVAAEACA